jgi:alpha/beta superfamily hydrolase
LIDDLQCDACLEFSQKQGPNATSLLRPRSFGNVVAWTAGSSLEAQSSSISSCSCA